MKDIIGMEGLKASSFAMYYRKSEYVIYKLKEMGKIREKDVMQICNQFNKLDENNSGKITLPSLLQSHL